jgi:hypothetical protein
MRALLEHSVQSHGHLPSAFAHVMFDPAPPLSTFAYPATCISKASVTMNSSNDQVQVDNTSKSTTAAPMLGVLEPFSPLVLDTIKTVKNEKKSSNSRPCVASTV